MAAFRVHLKVAFGDKEAETLPKSQWVLANQSCAVNFKWLHTIEAAIFEAPNCKMPFRLAQHLDFLSRL